MISLRDLYTVIYTSNYSSKDVLNLAVTAHKAMSLRHKFDKNMKCDIQLLIITEATFTFARHCSIVNQFASESKKLKIKYRNLVHRQSGYED